MEILPQGNEEAFKILELSPEEQSIVEFLNLHKGCADKQELKRFLEIVKGADWNGIDIKSIVRTLYLGGDLPKLVTGTGTRVSGMQFRQTTYGSTGKPEPSLLWMIADKECGNLSQLNILLEKILSDEYGLEIPSVPLPKPMFTPEEYQRRNQGLAKFFSTHEQCKADEQSIYKFLDLIDSYKLRGVDVFALVRTYILELKPEGFPLPTYSMGGGEGTGQGWRVGDMTITPSTLGTRGKSRDIVKHSLLWVLLSKYCKQMPEMVEYFNNILKQQIEMNQSKKK